MQRKVAGAALALVVGFGCSGCGNAGPATRTLVSRSGSGSATLGTVALRGETVVSVECTGDGKLTVAFAMPGSPSSWSMCPHANYGTVGMRYHRRAKVTVDAPAGVNWSVTIDERLKK